MNYIKFVCNLIGARYCAVETDDGSRVLEWRYNGMRKVQLLLDGKGRVWRRVLTYRCPPSVWVFYSDDPALHQELSELLSPRACRLQ